MVLRRRRRSVSVPQWWGSSGAAAVASGPQRWAGCAARARAQALAFEFGVGRHSRSPVKHASRRRGHRPRSSTRGTSLRRGSLRGADPTRRNWSAERTPAREQGSERARERRRRAGWGAQ
eukprot:1921235-Prymnesium_polylepis.1